MPDGAPPIYIIKKKKGHGGHHGGAWKVAYADFVTAMMALFIVLWLLSSSEQVKKAVGGYFSDPTGTGKQPGAAAVGGQGEGLAVSREDMNQLKEKLEEAMKAMPEFKNFGKQVELTVTADGLRVELIETDKGMFFESGIAKPTDQGEHLLVRLGEEMGRLPNRLAIEGHTDAKPFGGENYTNWELSTDRANAARRILQSSGLRADQVAQVRGFADQRLRVAKDPENASNRRISVIVHYLNGPPDGAPAAQAAAAGGHGEPDAHGKTDAHGAPAANGAHAPAPAANGAHAPTPAANGAHAKPSAAAPAQPAAAHGNAHAAPANKGGH